ncbi:GNAT family N-acetyltransferase [Glycomyces algeriensis]|uniref:N-acetyltransferase n=1 Tax=Glycomyces algeriensis TaxID=256037 RepID=A0A9W6G5C0_9ACTN|nr:GNAT family N-acetyltransferase [Glycomyces algeriensis]MDA1367659.1 GNAT family N-acetyltransferase [Glycomyces algeriensis]MDR7353000.1 GNAT superfamily N-acetyltransferase [Glycomyces algeriensis]GLI40690.1 N-acetyltransferase [Glycomyces algeriensis]
MTYFDIVRVDPNDHALVQSWFATREAVAARDWPGTRPLSPVYTWAALVLASSDVRRERWAAVRDDRVLGYLDLSLPFLDNTHLMNLELGAHPDERRRGVGSALLRHAEQRAAEEGRTSISSWVPVPVEGGAAISPDGSHFAAHQGYRTSLEGATRACDLDAVDDSELERLWDDAWERAEGFELVTFAGAPPAELLDGIAYLHSRMYTDMPLGDWDLQEAAVDGERILKEARVRRLRGELHLQAVVRHKETGSIAGLTEVIVEAGGEEHCIQGDTIVDPRFRGHRLGTILKIANQRAVREWRPKMRYVWTGNATSNTHMIAINEAVGYRLVHHENVYQKKR